MRKRNMKEREMEESPVKCRINVLITILTALAALLCLHATVQVISQGYVNCGGYSLFRVVTGSMEPTLPVGTLLLTEQTDMQDVQVDDIICFQAQESAIFGKMMTHRVVGIHTGADGALLFETKGDANLAQDGYLVTRTNFVGKVIWHTGAGNVLSSIFSFFTNKVGFLACIVLPCFLLAGLLLRDSVQNIRRELKLAMDEMERKPEQTAVRLELTPEEREEMSKRIRAELTEELMHGAQGAQKPTTE